LFMTNINVPVVGFLAQAPGFGVCEPRAIGGDGSIDLSRCKTAFMRRYEYWSQQRPRYFFYFDHPALFPGFADCLPKGTLVGQERDGNSCMDELRHRLARQYVLVFENRLMKVFDLERGV